MGTLEKKTDIRRPKNIQPQNSRLENIFGKFTNHAICGLITIIIAIFLIILAFFPYTDKEVIEVFSKALMVSLGGVVGSFVKS